MKDVLDLLLLALPQLTASLVQDFINCCLLVCLDLLLQVLLPLSFLLFTPDHLRGLIQHLPLSRSFIWQLNEVLGIALLPLGSVGGIVLKPLGTIQRVIGVNLILPIRIIAILPFLLDLLILVQGILDLPLSGILNLIIFLLFILHHALNLIAIGILLIHDLIIRLLLTLALHIPAVFITLYLHILLLIFLGLI